MRKLRVVGLFVAPAVLLFVAQAGAAKQQANKVKQTGRPVWSLAMDGTRVAYMTADRRVAVWNLSIRA